ncbi:MAG: ribosomal protection-like ABC-F family protein [Christensenellales bacterium]
MSRLLLEARDIEKSYGLRKVLDIESFELYDGDRVGLVGENGAGKTTLFQILSGQIEPDTGAVARLAPISVIEQTGALHDYAFDPALRSEFGAIELREGLSGGEKTRRRIAGALTARGHVLLADEPTTDLDAQGVERLEKRLREYEGAIVLISHDRALLDALCTKIAQLEDGRLTVFPGNYSAYRQELERRRAHQQFKYDSYRAEQGRIRGMIQREVEHASQKQHLPKRMGNSEARLHKRSVTNVQARIHQLRKGYESRLDRLEEVDRPREDPAIAMRLGAASPITSRTAVEIRDMNLRAGSKMLLEGASMRLPTGTRTALLGENGCGKSTLIARIVRGNDPRVRMSPGVKMGWFDQDHSATLDLDASALENAMARSVFPEAVVRTIMARLMIRGDDVFKPARVLSGGERAKVALARLFAADINLLILDEPTNHIDVFTLEALQDVLSEYAGTLLFVSHDRRFVREIAQRLVFFEARSLVTFEGDMEQYEKSRAVNRPQEDLRLLETTLQMRMAALVARMSAPKKGDSPEKLNDEYDALARRLAEVKARL